MPSQPRFRSNPPTGSASDADGFNRFRASRPAGMAAEPDGPPKTPHVRTIECCLNLDRLRRGQEYRGLCWIRSGSMRLSVEPHRKGLGPRTKPRSEPAETSLRDRDSKAKTSVAELSRRRTDRMR